jgi:ribosomal protein L36
VEALSGPRVESIDQHSEIFATSGSSSGFLTSELSKASFSTPHGYRTETPKTCMKEALIRREGIESPARHEAAVRDVSGIQQGSGAPCIHLKQFSWATAERSWRSIFNIAGHVPPARTSKHRSGYSRRKRAGFCRAVRRNEVVRPSIACSPRFSQSESVSRLEVFHALRHEELCTCCGNACRTRVLQR